MPKLVTEERSRDLAQMIADQTRNEEAPPTGVDLPLSRFATQSDILQLTEDFDDLLRGPAYKAVNLNLIDDPTFRFRVPAWQSSFDGTSGGHVGTVTSETTVPLLQVYTTHSARAHLTNSTGTGRSFLSWPLGFTMNSRDSVVGEIWMWVRTLRNAYVDAYITIHDADTNTNLGNTTLSAARLTAVTTDWTLVPIPAFSVTVNNLRVFYTIRIFSTGANAELDVYLAGPRVVLNSVMVPWNERAIANYFTAA